MFIYQFMLVVSILLMLVLILLISLKNRKKQIHYAIMAIAISLLSWNVSVLCQISFPETRWMLAVSEIIYFISIIFVSSSILFAGLIFSRRRIRFSWKYALLLVVPVISLAVLFTNPYHHLFYTKFSLIPSEQDFGFYYAIHTAYSYLCTGAGLFYFLSFAAKNYGFFSRQALIVFFAILIALIADSMSTFHIFDWSAAMENVIFSVTIILLILAIMKFDFLSVVPIALQMVVDIISDFYVVFGEENEIIDFNKAFAMSWSRVSRKNGISAVIKQNCPDFDEYQFDCLVGQSIREQAKVSLEILRPFGGGVKYYLGEITPVFIKGSHVGTILLMKDITEQKNNLEEVIRLNEKLQSLATKDGLTHAYNRYFFDERLEQEIDRVGKLPSCGEEAIHSVDTFGLIMFDIDYFKIYNDLNGHQAGDELLQTLVDIVKEVLFSNDILCRYGGEEFAVICCHIPAEEFEIKAEKIRKAVEEYAFKYQNTQPDGNLTISVGAAYCMSSCCKKNDLIQKADQNLYQAKNNGRNQVVLWRSETLTQVN